MFFRKKKRALFGKNMEVSCAYCANGTERGGAAVCRLNRCPAADGGCPRFSYDPLKRTPRNLPPLKPHDPEEFKL